MICIGLGKRPIGTFYGFLERYASVVIGICQPELRPRNRVVHRRSTEPTRRRYHRDRTRVYFFEGDEAIVVGIEPLMKGHCGGSILRLSLAARGGQAN